MYEPSASKELRSEIRNFIHQLIQNPLTFTACGFFDLDHTFIQNVIGSVTTYLVILIQVGDGPKKGANIRDFIQQLIQNPLTFTACGFFDLDHTFIRSVIGSVTTYLVILIQVGNTPLKFFVGNSSISSTDI
ncbi:hypothetical protein KPH14_007309 [Odynerus spinipes]|uniref:Gustatory receptor n=1 Tax=Odynerus spinipes TaxID=1348599 RepID=A0AAD9RA17_9HYME|nr:hypothetical protein KPH14_007309 [Odynerus spinipes]